MTRLASSFSSYRSGLSFFLAVILLLMAVPMQAQDDIQEEIQGMGQDEAQDVELTLQQEEPVKKKNIILRVIEAFDDVDTSYVESIPYNFTAMVQASSYFEFYKIDMPTYDKSLSFAEKPNLKIGPYFGWRWLFFGYTFDVLHVGNRPKKRGIDFIFSLYTSKLGVDLLYRRTGSNFYFRTIEGFGEEAQRWEGEECNDYINTAVTGAKVYYIFNSRRFSNRAIYSQSTIQRRSAGSFQMGASFSLHDVRFNYNALPANAFGTLATSTTFSTLERVKYTDYSLQIGYAYNWAFAHNWCLGISLLPAVGLKWTNTKTAILRNTDADNLTDKNEDDRNGPFYKLYDTFRRQGSFGLDFTARSGIIWNNGRWFAGLTGILHNYNYRRNDIRFSNTFGSLNIFCGFVFQKRKSKSEKTKVEAPASPTPQPVIEY